MALHRFSTVLLAAGLGFAVLMGGCFKGPSPLKNVQYFVLAAPSEPSDAGGQGTATGPRLGIMPVSLPAYLQRPQMVLRADNSVDVSVDDFNRWGEDLELGIVRVVSISVSNHLKTVKGTAAPLRTGVPVDYRLQLEVRKFEGQPGGQANLETVWRIQKDGSPVKEGHFSARENAGSSVASLVTAQSLLLERLGKEIATGMLEAWSAGNKPAVQK